MRDSAGISPDFALHRHPDLVRGVRGIVATMSGDGVLGPRTRERTIFEDVKRLLLIALALALVGVLVSVKLRKPRAMPEPEEEGSWELADAEPSA